MGTINEKGSLEKTGSKSKGAFHSMEVVSLPTLSC